MTNADVIKLSCSFVKEVVSYLTNSKYIVNPCLDEVRQKYSDYILATTLYSSDCLTHEDECRLEKLASLLQAEPAPTVTTVSCTNTASVSLSKTSRVCTPTVSVTNPSGIASSFPVLTAEDNSIYHRAYSKIKAESCGETYTTDVETGCISLANSSPVSCDNAYKTHININYKFSGLPSITQGYIKTLRVYATDVNGVLDPTPIDLNLAPSNLAAWTVCGSCSGITSSHLRFGNSNWKNAFKTLMENVSYTLYSGLKCHFEASITSSLLTISNKVKHNPSGVWFGINKNDFYMQWVDNDSVTNTLTTASTTYSGSPNYMGDEFSLSTPCGNITGRAVMSAGTAFDFTTSNFNYLGVGNPTLDAPVSIVNLTSPSCTIYTLKAVYTPLLGTTVMSIEWRNPANSVVSTDSTVEVTAAGTYSFKVYLDNNCIVTRTITV